jgi:hypothetical protein
MKLLNMTKSEAHEITGFKMCIIYLLVLYT